tara:strand:+ start:9391 stop:12930 length:3540 start_codon:yes stop_codon:yes gene_type:complete
MSLFRRLRRRLRRLSRRSSRPAFTGFQSLEGRVLLSAVTASSAAAFVDSIGINTHFGKSSGMFANPNLLDTLGDLGITHIRDNTNNTTAVDRLEYLYDQYGITTNMVVDWVPIDIAQRVQWLENDWAESIEGLNEPDLHEREYLGLKDSTYPSVVDLATRQYQFDLFNAVNANPLTADKPVLSPSQGYTPSTRVLGDIPFDVIGFHRYAGGINNPETLNMDGEDFFDLSAISHTGDEPIWLTETGYNTAEQEVHPKLGVSDAAQAKYLTRGLADAFMQGVDRTYLYELADEGTDETDMEDHFGIVEYQSDPTGALTLKPAGESLKRLIDHLNDSVSSNFTPGELDFTIDAGSADISNLRYLLLEENDGAGTFNLLIWQEVNSYDAANQQEINNPPLNVTIRFNDTISSAAVYNLNSDTAVSSYGSTKVVSVAVPDEIMLIKLTPGTYNPSGSLPILEVTATDPVAVEGTSDTGTFTFTRTGDTSQPYTFWVEIQGEAANGADYTSQSTGIVFPAGSSTVTKTITAINDSVAEGDEQVVMRIWGNTTHTVGEHWSASVNIIDDEAQADLAITDISWDVQNPQPGDAVTFYVTVQNQGTQATVGNASLYVQPTYNWGSRLYSTVNSGLAAGATTVVTMPGTWTATPGFAMPKAEVDYYEAVYETNEDNNYWAETLAVGYATRDDDFESGIDTTDWTGWDITGNWQAVTYGSNTVLENQDLNSANASPVTTYLPSTFATQWSSEFDYDWRWGGNTAGGYGFYSLTVSQDLLDDSGNGYRILVHQGDSNNSNNTNKTIQIFQVDSGVVASTPLAEGAGYDQPGFKSMGLNTPQLKHIKIDYDQIAGTISVYGDADADGQLELFAQAQGALPYDRITHVTMNTNTTATCAPVLDNLQVNLYNPLDTHSDDFEANVAGNAPANWYASGNWQAATYNGNTVIENLDTTAGGRYIASGWSLPYDAAWEASIDYDWKWAGDPSVGYGYYYMYGYMDILDADGNGYRLKIHQGDHNNANNTNKVLELYRRENWAVTTLLGTSAGYNEPGWQSRGLSGPDLKRIVYAYEPSNETFSVYADPDRNGELDLMMQVADIGSAQLDLDRVYIGAEGFTATERFTLDNVRIDQLHTRDVTVQTMAMSSSLSASAAMATLAQPGATLTPITPATSSRITQLSDSTKDRWTVTLLPQ